MNKFYLFLLVALVPFISFAQFPGANQDTSWKKTYRATTTKTHDLIHTKLEADFDFSKSYMNGKEWLTLKPTCYAYDSVVLDAKGMEINSIALMEGSLKKPLKYNYDGMLLNIKLNKTYSNKESFTLYFEFVSKPNELKVEGSAAITDAKGLYFINPDGKIKNKPTQIWTQGETESNSAWMITIDKPNQKTTGEILMTVPDKFVTLSNGLLISQKKNISTGTRTDHWKMDLPHAPYLFFMGVGEYSIVKDKYKGKEVNYYVEKAYEPYAKLIFGNTPEMMKFFSEKLGVEFPWQKYSQIVGRDYVSGAMENTTATLHQESAYQNARQLLDGNAWEETIAHELFHQWFGDLVTTESWSNLTVNESFANYSEYLWDEYKYGKDFADAHNNEDMNGYLMSGSEQKDLVRFFYSTREDMFDAVSYNKGGRILHMLRNYVGDEAFFKALNLYLTSNKFKTGEAHQLRLAFEEVTGKDLNWFWNQWYFGKGHPQLEISYNYDIPGKAKVFIKQTQKTNPAFILPIKIDVYENGIKKTYPVTISNRIDSFSFDVKGKPEWISVDADRILLGTIKDKKSDENYLAQWKYGTSYMDRKDALKHFAANNMAELAQGLNDKFSGLRIQVINDLKEGPQKQDAEIIEQIEKIAKTDKNKKVQAAAIGFLASTGNARFKSLFEQYVNDSSYSVAGEAFKGLADLDQPNAYALAKKHANDAKGKLGKEVNAVLIENGKEEDFELVADAYGNMPLSETKFEMTDKFLNYLTKINDLSKIKAGLDEVIELRNMIPEQYRTYVDAGFKPMFDKLIQSKGKEIGDYIESKMK